MDTRRRKLLAMLGIGSAAAAAAATAAAASAPHARTNGALPETTGTPVSRAAAAGAPDSPATASGTSPASEARTDFGALPGLGSGLTGSF